MKELSEEKLVTEEEREEMRKICKAVDEFSEAMKQRLCSKIIDGYRGWDDPKSESTDTVSCKAHIDMVAVDENYSVDAIDKQVLLRLMIDISNRMMMLWVRENKTIDK